MPSFIEHHLRIPKLYNYMVTAKEKVEPGKSPHPVHLILQVSIYVAHRRPNTCWQATLKCQGSNMW